MLDMQRVQAPLTLFPKYFAPFPHGTCLLLSSRQYSDVDGIYHQFSAPVPGNATLVK